MATPSDVPGIKNMDPVSAYTRGRESAKKEARQEARKEVLDILERRYMDTTVERDSPVAKAILTIAKDLAEEYRERGV